MPSQTQGQIVGARESLNGRENMARRKIKNGEKSPWGQCLARQVPNGRRRSGFWLVPENFCVFLGLRGWCYAKLLNLHYKEGLKSLNRHFNTAKVCDKPVFSLCAKFVVIASVWLYNEKKNSLISCIYFNTTEWNLSPAYWKQDFSLASLSTDYWPFRSCLVNWGEFQI